LQFIRHRQLISLNTQVERPNMMAALALESPMLSNIKSILIATTPDRKESTALNYGLSLAQVSEAHVAVEILAPKIVLGHMHIGATAADLIAAENQRTHRLAESMAESARRDAEMQGVPCRVDALQKGHVVVAGWIAARARVHDIAVLDAEPDTLALGRSLIEGVLFHGGRPVIIVPPKVDRAKSERIVIAWDGSDRAARAVGDAMPFLRAAKEVEIVSIAGEKALSAEAPATELAPLLARHAINATVKDLHADHGDVAGKLREQASLYRADMIVMGAFARSWLRQMTLGGVTQALLKECAVPLLLSH
jgi:nucleotide-binding universal stress UspA family protein